MSMKDQLANDLKDAMRSGDSVRRDVLRLLLTAISNAEIARVNIKDESAVRTGLTDADEQARDQHHPKAGRQPRSAACQAPQ